MVYLRDLDLSFVWTRGDGFQYVTRGYWREDNTLVLCDGGRVPHLDRPATAKLSWQDDADVYREINVWLAANRPDWHRVHGPVQPGPDGNPVIRNARRALRPQPAGAR